MDVTNSIGNKTSALTVTGLADATNGTVRVGTTGALTRINDSATNGQVLISSSDGAPAWASLTAGDNVTITPGTNSITIAASGGGGGGGITWSVKDDDFSMAADNGYLCNKATAIVGTLPATCSVGKVFRVAGFNTGKWKVAQNADQYIIFGDQTSTVGTDGYIEAGAGTDAVEMVCIVADVGFLVVSSIGNITVA